MSWVGSRRARFLGGSFREGAPSLLGQRKFRRVRRSDAVRQAVFGTVAQALVPAAPGLIPAHGV